MIIDDLNGIEFSEIELSKYKEIGNITDEKMNILTKSVNSTLRKTNLKAVHDKIKVLLEDTEKIEDIVEGLDMDKVALATRTGKYTVSASFEYALNKILFFTNRRVFVVSLNACNTQFQFKEYKKSDIKSIESGKDNPKLSQMGKISLRISYILGFIMTIFILQTSILIRVLLYILYMLIFYKIIKLISNNSNTILIRFNDGYVFEMAPKNNMSINLKNYIQNWYNLLYIH